MIYIAVICRKANLGQFKDLKCVTALDKDTLIRRAIETRDLWWHAGGNGPYEIFVGELREQVVIKPSYTLTPVGGIEETKENAKNE